MTCLSHNRFLLPAWGISLVLHGIAIAIAVVFAAQVRPAFQQDPFTWEVALVDAVDTESTAAATPVQEPAAPPPQQPAQVAAARPVEPMETVHRVAPRDSVQMVHPEAAPSRPAPPKVEDTVPPLKREPAPLAKPPQEPIVEPIEQRPTEAPNIHTEPVKTPKEPEPVQTAEPLMTQQQPVAVPSDESVETPPADNRSTPSMPEPVASLSPEPAPAVPSPPTLHPAPIQSAKPAPSDLPSPSTLGPAEAPAQIAKAAPSHQEVRTDHRWLAESLWRRVAELKRYPTSARLNGQEGKVILKAVIRSDGHLAEVSVQKSSGHHVLDAAAIEAVKLACPLHMKHAISKPEIVVSLPIVYRLAN